MDRNGRKGITVALMAGDYRVKPLRFTKEDGGTKECPVTWCAYGDGEVTLNGGVSVDLASFVPVKDRKVMSRLQKDVRKKVVCLPLARYPDTGWLYLEDNDCTVRDGGQVLIYPSCCSA